MSHHCFFLLVYRRIFNIIRVKRTTYYCSWVS